MVSYKSISSGSALSRKPNSTTTACAVQHALLHLGQVSRKFQRSRPVTAIEGVGVMYAERPVSR